ncbi:hypothetical protein H7A76_12355 [Pseudomonas sp. MSSRFD41]|uniref:hypothetical protein n=1 Tax=Pseudomonas sp. MSSRFD41 TaxID=1310370 RepID=UPI00163B507D|nr:hypothetical protein [Pseudomonas sp. MSSRFD41]MBC2656229.1 hypothetical protein [Pseudomonas sp. MSSRFD41]
MKFISAGKRVEPRRVGYRSLGFGEATSLETTPFELLIAPGELAQGFIQCADGFISQCRDDDLAQGFADIVQLQRLGYPKFEDLLANQPQLAAGLIKDYLYFDLLHALFPNTSALALVINEIASVLVAKSTVTITGLAFPVDHRHSAH